MANYVNTNGVTYAITDHQGFLGVRDGYRVAITDPDGARIYAGVIHPAIFGAQTNGDVLLGTRGQPCVVPAPAGGTYIVPPGVYATFGIGPATGHVPSGSTFYIGGNALLSVALGAPAGLHIHVLGGSAMFAPAEPGATLDGMTVHIANGGIFTCGTGLAEVLCGATVRFGAGGGALVVNADHALFDLSGTAIVDYTPEQTMIEVRNTTQPVVSYHVMVRERSRTIVLRGHKSEEIGRFTVELASGAQLAAGEYRITDGAHPLRIACDKAQARTRTCLIEGTYVTTAGHAVALETLQTGSLVDVWGRGGATTQRIAWVGYGHVQVRPDQTDEQAGYPIRVLRHALAQNVPERDLLLTPNHSVLHNGQFVPVRMLVNGSSIFYDRSITAYNYSIIQTETHAVLVSDGVATDFYLALDHAGAMAQEGTMVRIGHAAPQMWEKEVPPVLQRKRAPLAAAFTHLRERSAGVPGCRPMEDMPEQSMDPELFLVTDKGQRVRLLRRDGDRYFYMLPAGVEKVFLTSRTSQPSVAIGPYMDDWRTLGVSVGGITLFSGGRHVAQLRHLKAEGAGWSGWYPVEADGARRWTNGYAELPLTGMKEGQMGLLTIQVHAGGPFVVTQALGAETAKLRA